MTHPALPRRRDRVRDRTPIWLSRILFLAGLLSLIGALITTGSIYFWVTLPFNLLALPIGPGLFPAALLIVLAGPIGRRYRAAHSILLGLMLLTTLTSLLAVVIIVGNFIPELELDAGDVWLAWVSVVTNVAATAYVWWARPAFVVRMRARPVRNALGILVSGLVVAYLVVFGLLTAVSELPAWPARARWSLMAVLGISSDTSPWPAADWVHVVGGLLAGSAVVAAFYLLWRAETEAIGMSADDELRVRALLLEHGEDDSLGYFATRRDKAVTFSPDGRAAVAHRMHGEVAVASGDPIGDPDSWPAAIDAFLTHAHASGRYATVLSASRNGAELYARRGLTALALGDEAVLHTDRFTLAGPAMRAVRHAVGRVERAGYTAEINRFAALTPEAREEAADLADLWRGSDTERGFSMALGRVRDPADGQCLLVLAKDAQGEPQGLLSFAPWGRHGASLDLMRRSPAADNGITEFMVASLMKHAEELGIQRISLNFAVFRHVFSAAEQVGAGPVTRLSNALLKLASRFYQLDSLYRSNDKYSPQWSPRLLCYEPGLTAARAAWAMAVAEGFLPSPRRGSEEVVRDEHFLTQLRALEAAPPVPALPTRKLNDQQRVRRRKAAEMDAAGRAPNPPSVPRSHSIAEARTLLSGAAEGRPSELHTGEVVSITGRVRALRDLGGVTFAVLEEDGERLQALVSAETTPADQRTDFRRWVDLGDIVSVTGELGTSRSGEPSLWLASWQMAAKCFNPMPDLHSRLAENARARNRVLDLITSDDSLDHLRRRGLGVQALRAALVGEGYLEVETPMLQQIHGGAAARPFITHINAYDMELYLRIAPELYLKRLTVAGMGRIFEVGRNFRNEGADATHNPEFTACEVYAPYTDYVEMRELTRRLILAMATAVNGRPVAIRPDGNGGVIEVDLTPEWPVVTIHEAVSRASGHQLHPDSSRDEVATACRAHEIDVPAGASAGELVMELYDALVEKQTTFPTFYCDFPREVSPLARPHRSVPGLTEQWDLVAFGAELGCAYSELTDPLDQRDRLTAQSLAAAAGDPEAMQLDEDFLASLEYGMPPTGGLGIGVDRIIMLLLGQPIRATLAFPFVRPQG
ncbi:bifunctional lysylphosphatidylglycerol synthetase/lysine--tRNA ligase LysX [Enemella sp. A6]|uniref:bifunctional lysylphosphatidylglycerol synthetase/lysine--tRNA ligase LysX n=1 Tax=Enemella sp. A6 TaxID=3440152 RepID=UPI003EB90BAD